LISTWYEEVIDGLLDAYPEMDAKAYQNVLKDALVASHLVGAAKARTGGGEPPQRTR
jgi:phage gp29-like protein